MATKKEQLTRMSQKHDIEAHWKLAENFIPIAGEIIVYDPDEVYDYARFKCGDGVTKVNDLPFIFKIDKNYATKEYVNDAIANIAIEVDSTLTKEGEAADAKAVGDKFNNYETKENVQKITDELAKVKETAEAARTEEEVNAQIDAKVSALELSKTYEPIGAETRAKAYADDLMTDANLDQYATEKEVKDIVDTIVADAVSGDAVTGLANLVEYFHTHGEEAAQMGAAITELEGDVKNLKEAPSAGIKATDISAWNGEVGAKALAATKTTTEEVKTQIEAYDYATKTYVGDAIANIKSIVDVTELPTENIDKDIIHRIPGAGINPELYYVNTKGEFAPYLDALNAVMAFAADDGSGTPYDPLDRAEYILVDELPETGMQLILGQVVYVYIIKSTGIGYLPTEDEWISAGSAIFGKTDCGWSENIDDETVEGIYAVYSDSTNSIYNIFDGKKWATLITETDKTLSKENYAADAKVVGDITSTLCIGVDIWIVDGSGAINLTELAAADGATFASKVVDELPEILEPIDPVNLVFNVYVVKETGIGYMSFNGQVMSLGYFMSDGQSEAYNKGWSTDINSETEVGIYCVRKLANIKELTDTVNNLFEAVPGETTHVSNTLTWDGNINGRTHWEKTTSEGELSMTAQWVHVSDSIPTYEELTAGFEVVESNGLHRVYDPNEEFHWISITDDENCITLTFNEIGIVLLPRIIKIPHTDSNGVVWEKTGIYFMKYNLTTAEGSDGDYTQSFTIPGYDFTVTAPDKKVIKDELIQIDATLTQEGKPADAKAVRDAITWENLPDKPFYELTESLGDTVAWDGNLDTFKGVVTNTLRVDDLSVCFVKVSDSVPIDDIDNNCTMNLIFGNNNMENIAITKETTLDGGIITLGTENFEPIYIVPTDNLVTDLGLVFPEKGVYFMNMIMSNDVAYLVGTSLTIPNYNFTNTTLKKIDEKYLPKAAKGIIDVDELPTINIDEKLVYRIKTGLFFHYGESFFRHGTSYFVDELPKTGEPCTLDGKTVNAVYYEQKTNDCYVYVPSSVAPALSVDEGWHTTAMLLGALDYKWGGVVTSLQDMIESSTFYFLKKPYYGAYSNGAWAQLSNTSWNDLQDKPFYETKQELGDTVTWDGNLDEETDVVTNPFPYGIGELRFVKVSNSIPTIDDIGSTSTINYTNGGVEKTDNVRAEDVEGRIMVRGNGDFLLAVIIRTDNTILDEIIFPKKGVYFALYDLDEVPDTRAISLTIPNYNFVNTVLKQIDEKYLPIFEKVKGATVNVGETLAWDGDTEGKVVIEYHVPDTNGYGITMDVTYVKVSDSIPTYDEIMAGSQVLTVGGNGVGTSSGTFYVVQENDQRITIGHGDGLYATPRIVKTPHTDSNSLTWPEAGVYFTILKVATQDQSNEDRTQSFTITGYDFIVQEPDKNVIKDELIQVDTTLMQEGKPADAKAVGDRLALLEASLGAYITDIDSLVGGGITNEEEPSEPIPAFISFTIAGTNYQAEEGMTWSEWVNSEYNTNGWTDDGEYVYNSFGVDVTFVSTDGTLSGRVTPNETIINGTDYHTRDAG